MEAADAFGSDHEAALEPDPEPIPDPSDAIMQQESGVQAPDVSEQLAALNRGMESLTSQQAQPQAPDPTREVDPIDSLFGGGGEQYGDESEFGGETPEQPYQEPGQLEGQEADQLEEVRQIFRQEAEATLAPHLERMETQRRAEAIFALAEEYPDLREEGTLSQVEERLGPFVDAYGKQAMTDPYLVELAYKAYKADVAASAETPAEVGKGAMLETNAGPGGQGDTGKSDQEQFVEAMLSARGGGDSFTN